MCIRDRCEQTLTDTIKLAHPKIAWVQESGLYLVSKLSYSQFRVEVRNFSLPWQRVGLSSLTDTFKLVDLKTPLLEASIWVMSRKLSYRHFRVEIRKFSLLYNILPLFKNVMLNGRRDHKNHD